MITSLLVRFRPEIEKINLYTAIAIAFSLPFFKFLIPVLILIWIFTWILEGNFKTKFISISNKPLLFIIISFYLYHVIGLLYSENIKSALFDLEVKFSLFIIPVIIATSNYLYKEKYKTVFIAFVIGNIIAAFVCLINALIIGKYSDNNFNDFYYQPLSIFLHPSYFSMYIAFSVIIAFYFWIHSSFRYRIWLNVAFYMTIFIFLAVIYLLSSRAGIFVGIVILLFFIIYYVKQKTKLIYKLLFIAFAVVFIAYTFKHNGRIITGIKQLKETWYNTNEQKFTSANDRLMIWYSSLDIIKKNFWFGVGNGDIKGELESVYGKKNLSDARINRLNAHNQFIETWIGLGVVGFITLLLLFILPLTCLPPACQRGRARQASLVKNNKFLIAFFLIIVGFNFLFESMLNTQAGVVFFSFFYSLLVFIPKDENQ